MAEIGSVRPYVHLEVFQVMPNHFHGILWISDHPRAARRAAPTILAGSLGVIINHFKGAVTRRAAKQVWQRNYYEHIVTDTREYEQIARYVVENPANWECDRFYEIS